jgi:hypothetical protein
MNLIAIPPLAKVREPSSCLREPRAICWWEGGGCPEASEVGMEGVKHVKGGSLKAKICHRAPATDPHVPFKAQK